MVLSVFHSLPVHMLLIWLQVYSGEQCCENLVKANLNPFIKKAIRLAKSYLYWQKLSLFTFLSFMCLGMIFKRTFFIIFWRSEVNLTDIQLPESFLTFFLKMINEILSFLWSLRFTLDCHNFLKMLKISLYTVAHQEPLDTYCWVPWNCIYPVNLYSP